MASGHDAGVDILGKVEVDGTKAWVPGSIWVAGDHTLRGRLGEHVGPGRRGESYLHDDKPDETVAEFVTVPADAHFDDKLECLFPYDAVILELDKWGDSLCWGVRVFR